MSVGDAEDRVLPSWTDDQLAGLPAGELAALLVENDDRVPRNLIDACAARGPRMVAALRERLVSRGDDLESGGECG